MNQKTMSKLEKYLILVLVVLIIAFSVISLRSSNYNVFLEQELTKTLQYNDKIEEIAGIGEFLEVHTHADFKVYINGERLDLYKPKNIVKNILMHIHSGESDVLHKEIPGGTLSHFFNSLGIKLSQDCITLENGEKLCGELSYYVNDELSIDGPHYELKDKDRVLITFGPGNLQQQLDSVGSDACKSSRNC